MNTLDFFLSAFLSSGISQLEAAGIASWLLVGVRPLLVSSGPGGGLFLSLACICVAPQKGQKKTVRVNIADLTGLRILWVCTWKTIRIRLTVG